MYELVRGPAAKGLAGYCLSVFDVLHLKRNAYSRREVLLFTLHMATYYTGANSTLFHLKRQVFFNLRSRCVAVQLTITFDFNSRECAALYTAMYFSRNKMIFLVGHDFLFVKILQRHLELRLSALDHAYTMKYVSFGFAYFSNSGPMERLAGCDIEFHVPK